MAARVFSVEYRSAVAQRMLNGERVLLLSVELKIKRRVLYRWRDAYRKLLRMVLGRSRAGHPAVRHK